MNDFKDRDDLADGDADDRLLAELLAAPQARANPAVWMRVRTRLSATSRPVGRLDGFLEWLTRPAALAAATAALVVSLGTGWSLIGTVVEPGATSTTDIASSEATSLIESLLESGTESAEPAGEDDAAPNDSGGRS